MTTGSSFAVDQEFCGEEEDNVCRIVSDPCVNSTYIREYTINPFISSIPVRIFQPVVSIEISKKEIR